MFHAIPESALRRRAGEILIFVMLAAAGLIAATLLAKGRPDPPRAAGSPGAAVVRR